MRTTPGDRNPSLDEIEIRLLLEGIALHYGYDFREYAPRPLRRSIAMSMAVEGISSISRYQDRLLHDPESMERFLSAVGGPTSMFGQAESLLYLRRDVAPWLRTFPSVRIWVAGCGTGEEVVSLAIVLHECGILHRIRIYATDLSERSLRIARTRAFPLENVRSREGEYARSGGVASLSDYYVSVGDLARFDRSLFANVTWARHNLVTDASFNDFHVILCTRALEQFGEPLRRRVEGLLHASLVPSGYLILAGSETGSGARRDDYDHVIGQPGLYRKARA